MALANDMTALLKKISRRIGLLPLIPHLPEQLNMEEWANTIMEDTMVTFSRYYTIFGFVNVLKLYFGASVVSFQFNGYRWHLSVKSFLYPLFRARSYIILRKIFKVK